MTTLFFFGAGASRGSIDCIPELPPVGPGLFAELQKQGGIFATISPDMAAEFVPRFEQGMARFILERRAERHIFVREMARYFLRFQPGPGNLYRTLLQRAMESRRHVIYSTINYDILLERSALSLGRGWSIRIPREHPRDIPILKLHGSCNIMPDLGNSVIRGASVGTSEYIYDGPCVAMLPENAERFLDTEDVMGPVIAMYEPKKRVVYAPTCLQGIQEMWRKEVERAHRIYVIGVAVNVDDNHVWDPLARAPGWIGYVGLKADADRFEAWAAKLRSGPSEVVAHTFENALDGLQFA